MMATKAAQYAKQKNKLPLWAKLLIAYACVLAGAVGLAYFWRLAFTLENMPALPFTFAVIGICSLFYAAFVAVVLLCKGRQNVQAALCVFLLGLLFCFANPPLQAPDEPAHFKRAYAMSTGQFSYDYSRVYPGDVDLLVQSFPGFYNHNVTYAGAQLPLSGFINYRQNYDTQNWPQKEKAPPANEDGSPAYFSEEPILFMLFPYALQAVFMAITRLFGGGALQLLYAGRIANLVLYSIISFFTFRGCSKYKGVFFTAAMLPISLFMAASCSYDGLLLALSYFMLSFFCKKHIYTKNIVWFGIAAAVAFYIKQPSVALLAILLLVPKPRWKSKVNPWLAFGIIAGGAVIVWQIGGLLVGLMQTGGWHLVSLPRGSGEEAAPLLQMQFILKNPLRFIATAMLTLYEEAAYLFKLGTFGWMDLSIPLVSGLCVLSLSASCALGIQQKDDTRLGGALGLFLAAMLYSGTVLAGMYVAESDLFSIRITGPQPRYFLPAFLLLFMLCSILLGKAVRPRLSPGNSLARTENISLCIAVGVGLLSVILLAQNNFIGQWIPKSIGGWKMVNLFGWQIL